MKQSYINYKILDKEFNSIFHHKTGNKYLSECKLFELQFLKKESGKTTQYEGKISWIHAQRPPAGLQLLDIQLTLDLENQWDELSIFRNGYQSWSYSCSHTHSGKDVSPLLNFLKYSQENTYTNHTGKKGDFQSEGFVCVESSKEKTGFFLGITQTEDQNCKFRIKLDSSGKLLSASCIYDLYYFPELKPTLQIKLTPFIYTEYTGGGENQLEKYFKMLGEKYVKKSHPNKVPTGWCSWYYYYTDISEEIILENLREVKKKNLPIAFFQIDDGYQNEIGDWLLTNDKFPGGMKMLASEIRKARLTPGIWLAPFLLRKKSEFFSKYPEAVLRDQDGKPVPALWNPLWGKDYTYTMDVTHPASENFLEKVFTTITKEWGYEYLKLDFLYSASLNGIPYKRDLTPAQRYVNAIKLIRKVVGKDKFILGCGAPIMPSIGLFEGMRIGCDVAPFWGPEIRRKLLRDRNAVCTEKALVNAVTRSSMHRNLWLNDPDCLLVRSDRNKMTLDQTILMAILMAVSGGMLLISDNLTTIEQDRLGILTRSLDLSTKCQGKTPLPLGLFEQEFPRGMYNKAGFIGIWNPTYKEEWVTVKLPVSIRSKKMINWWDKKELKDVSLENQGTRLSIKLQPFGSAVIEI